MAGKGLTAWKVVGAAADLADRTGLDAMTLAALAGKLDVRVPSLYKHVAGLDDLRVRIAELATLELGATLQRASHGRRGPDALGTMARAYRRYGVAHPGRFVAYQRYPDAGANLETAELPGTVVERVVRDCGVAEADLDAVLLSVRSSVRGFILLEITALTGTPEETDAAFERLLGMLHRELSTTRVGGPVAVRLGSRSGGGG